MLAFDGVVRGQGAEADLHQEQGDDHEEVLARRQHRAGRPQLLERIARRRRRQRLVGGVDRLVPDHQADGADQGDERGHRPHHRLGGGDVADQRLVRPVHRIGGGLARAVGGRRPRRPEDEGGQRLPPRLIRDRVARHRVLLAQRVHLGRAAEQAFVVGLIVADGGGADVADHQLAVGLVHPVAADLSAQTLAQRCLLLRGDVGIGGTVIERRPAVEDEGQLTVQPVGRPVGRQVGAVTPDRAELMAADRLPDHAAGLDVVAVEQNVAARRDDLVRNRAAC